MTTDNMTKKNAFGHSFLCFAAEMPPFRGAAARQLATPKIMLLFIFRAANIHIEAMPRERCRAAEKRKRRRRQIAAFAPFRTACEAAKSNRAMRRAAAVFSIGKGHINKCNTDMQNQHSIAARNMLYCIRKNLFSSFFAVCALRIHGRRKRAQTKSVLSKIRR